jgi:hydroxymethylpyrimidine/phosphomethylpyrimidine kinase
LNDRILSVGGYDPTAGAGVLLDSYLFTKFDVESKFVLTSVVIQSPFEVTENVVLEDRVVIDQLKNLSPYYHFPLINIGLINAELLQVIKNRFKSSRIIFDPIMASGSGKYKFLPDRVIGSLQGIFLLTPNIPEAEKLTRRKISDISDMKDCARQIRSDFGVLNVMLKGGHLKADSIDLLHDEKGRFTEYEAKKAGFRIHGTGSFLNAAITVGLQKDMTLADSITFAKKNLDLAASAVLPQDPILRIQN